MARKKQKVNFNKNFYEKTAWDDQKVVVGIDEVGRGCLAGPLVCSAVILPPGKISRHLKDSKIMTEKERLMAFRWITKRSWYGIGIVNNRTIDQHNIYQATLIAMKKALVHLLALYPYSKPSAILVDAMPLTTGDTSYKDIPIYHFPKGERKSSSIAAASIVAKVTRDGLMDSFNEIFPGYRWHTNKGYATKAHRAAVQELNHTIVHRMRFLNNTIHIEDEDFNEQQSLLEMIENQEAESVELLKQTESPQILGINKHEENKEW